MKPKQNNKKRRRKFLFNYKMFKFFFNLTFSIYMNTLVTEMFKQSEQSMGFMD